MEKFFAVVLTHRSHHGDLQIWHSMSDGHSSANDLKQRIISHIVARAWNAQGQRGIDDRKAAIDLGYAIHALQDAFSDSHVQRDASGAVVRYQNYNDQSGDLHAIADLGFGGPTSAKAVASRFAGNRSGAYDGINEAEDATAEFLVEVICKQASAQQLTAFLESRVFRHAGTPSTDGTDPRFAAEPEVEFDIGPATRRAAERSSRWLTGRH